MQRKVNWTRVTPDSEWIFFGTSDIINKDLIVNTINNHFADDKLYIAFTRKESMPSNKKDIEKAIDGFLGFQNFLIWDTGFKKAMEFNKIGTMRCGFC